MATQREDQKGKKRRHKYFKKNQKKSNFSNFLIFALFLGSFLLTFSDKKEDLLPWATNVFGGVKAGIKENSITEIKEIINTENIPNISNISNIKQSDIINSNNIPPIALNNNQNNTIFKRDYTKIDQAAANIKYSGTSVNELAQILSQYAKTEPEKARIIFSWIAYNITYDVSAFLSQRNSNFEPSEVLKYRLAVCAGYANLYEKLAQKMGLEAVTINGYAKGAGYIVGNNSDLNHGWNAVKIDENWYLIDSTWGAGHLENNTFIRKFNPYYFATPPEQFIYSHLPEDSQWQLLNNKYTKAKFESLPEISSQFFSTGLKLISHNEHTIKANNRVTITLAAPNDIIAIANLKSGANTLPDNYTFTQKENGNIIVNVSWPTAGNYELQIFAKNKEETGQYPHVITYKIIANSSGEQFPKTYGTFTENNGILITPLTYTLPKNKNLYFQVNIDNAIDVQVFNETLKEWTPLSRSGNTFSGNVFIKQGKTLLMAKFPKDNNRYWSLAEYH